MVQFIHFELMVLSFFVKKNILCQIDLHLCPLDIIKQVKMPFQIYNTEYSTCIYLFQNFCSAKASKTVQKSIFLASSLSINMIAKLFSLSWFTVDITQFFSFVLAWKMIALQK